VLARPIALRASTKHFLWGSIPTFLLIGLGPATSLLATCSPMESIRRD
jgi:hypothetical protein